METIRFFAEIIRLLEFPHSILFLTFCCFLSKKIGPEKSLSFWVKSLNWKSMVSLTKLKKGEHDLQHEDVSFLIQSVLLLCFLFFLKSSLFKFGLHLPYNTHETTNILFNSNLHNVKVPHKMILQFLGDCARKHILPALGFETRTSRLASHPSQGFESLQHSLLVAGTLRDHV